MPTKQRYLLVSPITTEFERDKGPLPSGYAKVGLTLQPCADNSTATVSVEADPDTAWRVLKAYNASTGEALKVPSETDEGFRREAIMGISQGAEAALQRYLDAPVDQVKVVVHEIVYHPVYSTIMAFRIATQEAIKHALDSARQQGLVVTRREKS